MKSYTIKVVSVTGLTGETHTLAHDNFDALAIATGFCMRNGLEPKSIELSLS